MPHPVSMNTRSVSESRRALVDWCTHAEICDARIVINEKRLRLNRNTLEAVHRAFRVRADMAFNLADDTVPSPDALPCFDWAVRE